MFNPYRIDQLGRDFLVEFLDWCLAQGDLSGFGVRADPDVGRFNLTFGWASGMRLGRLVDHGTLEMIIARPAWTRSIIGDLDKEAAQARREILEKFPRGAFHDFDHYVGASRPFRSLLELGSTPREVALWMLRNGDLSEASFAISADGLRGEVVARFPGVEAQPADNLAWDLSSSDYPAEQVGRMLDRHVERRRSSVPTPIPVERRFGDAPRVRDPAPDRPLSGG